MSKNKDWDKLARALLLVGGLNWGLIGLLGFNPIGSVFGGLARFAYIAIGCAAIYKISKKLSDA